MKRFHADWVVGDEGIRPAGKPTHCFYCNQERGAVHKPDCVIRKRTVVMRVQIDTEIVMSVPEDWTQRDIKFRYGESSWCADNILRELQERADREGGQSCLCDYTKMSFVREADSNDEETDQLFVAKLPS